MIQYVPAHGRPDCPHCVFLANICNWWDSYCCPGHQGAGPVLVFVSRDGELDLWSHQGRALPPLELPGEDTFMYGSAVFHAVLLAVREGLLDKADADVAFALNCQGSTP